METLRNEKGFQKVGRRQQKEVETMRKRHAKERQSMQKSQCSALEKAIKGKRSVQVSAILIHNYTMITAPKTQCTRLILESHQKNYQSLFALFSGSCLFIGKAAVRRYLQFILVCHRGNAHPELLQQKDSFLLIKQIKLYYLINFLFQR